MKLLGLGLNETDVKTLGLPAGAMKKAPAIASVVKKFDAPAFEGLSNAELHTRTLAPLTVFAAATDSSDEMLSRVVSGKGEAVFAQNAPWLFDYANKPYLRTTFRRTSYMVSRLLGNLDVPSSTDLLRLWQEKTANNIFPIKGKWVGLVDRDSSGKDKGWWKPEFNDASWKPIAVPGSFDIEVKELNGYIGRFWYRTHFTVPEFYKKRKPMLAVGAVDDESWIWVNGKFLGEVSEKTEPKDYWRFPRVYQLDTAILNPKGDNLLVILVNNLRGSGGIVSQPAITIEGNPAGSYYADKPVAEDDPYRYIRW
jgi:beta-galactosidase